MTKFVHHYLPIGELNFELTNICPHCGQKEIGILNHHQQDHFICCKRNKPLQIEIINTIKNKLNKIHTNGFLIQLIVELFEQFYGLNITIKCPAQFQPFYKSQKKISISNLARGKISNTLIHTISSKIHQTDNN